MEEDKSHLLYTLSSLYMGKYESILKEYVGKFTLTGPKHP